MNIKQFAIGILTVAYFIGAATLLTAVSQAQDAKVKTAMELLESKANKLGSPKIDGTDVVLASDRNHSGPQRQGNRVHQKK